MSVQDITSTDAVATELVDLLPAQRLREPDLVPTAPERRGRPMRVLAVGINFGPEHTGIAPYTTQLCDHLVTQGVSVSVLTGVPHYPGWSVDRRYRWCIRKVEKAGQLDVRRLRHYVPSSQSAVRRALYELTFALQVAIQRPSERPDVVLAVVPSLLSAVAAQRIAARFRIPLVVWVQDLMGPAAAQSGIDGGARVAKLVGSIEKWVLNRADRVLVLNPRFRDYVQSLGVEAARTTVRPNWTHVAGPSGASREELRARLGWRSDETIVLHTGNMGLKQDLENVIATARLCGTDRAARKVRFVLMGDGSQRRVLEESAIGVNALSFMAPASEDDYADVLSAADILLVNERPSSVDMCLPSKLTSYFRAGRPVIAASDPAGGTAAELIGSGGGIVVEPGDPQKLLNAVHRLADDPDASASMGLCGKLYAAEHLDADRAVSGVLESLRLLADSRPTRYRAPRRGRRCAGPTVREPTGVDAPPVESDR